MRIHKYLYLVVIVLVWCFSSNIYAQPACTGKQIFTSRACAGDATSADEQTLFELVNKYRAANGQPQLRLSSSLSMVANRRMLDLKQNTRVLTHSWSNCPYDIAVQTTWPCVLDAPEKFNSGYKGQGFETLYSTTTGKVVPRLAVEAWSKSTLHNSIILNLATFKDLPWNEVGVAIDGQYAALWFGHPGPGAAAGGEAENGLGVSYDQAVAGLAKTLSISQVSSEVEAGKWQGYSADKKIRLEVYGSRKDVSEAKLGVSVKLDGGTLGPQARTAISTLLGNLFPEWADHDSWIAAGVAALAKDRTAMRTKVVRKINIDLESDGASSIKLTIRPESKKAAVEVF